MTNETNYYKDITEEEKEKIRLEIAKSEYQEYVKEHYKPCSKCGGEATNEFPNNAGVMEECNWFCPSCEWVEN